MRLLFSQNGGKIPEYVRDYQLLERNPTPWIYVRIHRDSMFIRNQQISIEVHGVTSHL
jgi:hypothetical protein